MCEVGTNCDKQDVNASLAFNILYIYISILHKYCLNCCCTNLYIYTY